MAWFPKINSIVLEIPALGAKTTLLGAIANSSDSTTGRNTSRSRSVMLEQIGARGGILLGVTTLLVPRQSIDLLQAEIDRLTWGQLRKNNRTIPADSTVLDE